jgi:hypothetical protein
MRDAPVRSSSGTGDQWQSRAGSWREASSDAVGQRNGRFITIVVVVRRSGAFGADAGGGVHSLCDGGCHWPRGDGSGTLQ